MSQLKVDNITDELGTGAPNFPNGLTGSELTEAQAEDDTSTVFGTVSGQRLNQETKASLNVSGAAPMFACRAWANFKGTFTVSIRESGNVSSITDNGTGDYTMNFTTAMEDANYCCAIGGSDTNNDGRHVNPRSLSTTSVRILTSTGGGSSRIDINNIFLSVFR